MEMCYKSKGTDNFLEVRMGKVADIKNSSSNYRIKMLENNLIENLFKPVSLELDEDMILRYNTRSYYVLDRLFVKFKPDGNFFGVLLEQLRKCMSELDRYLLDYNDVLLSPEYMFYDWWDKRLMLICVPGYGKSIRVQFKTFLEYIMKIFDYRDQQGVSMLYGSYERAVEENFSFDDILCVRILERGEQDISDKKTNVNESDVNLEENNQESCIKKLVPLTNGALREIKLNQYDEMILVGRGKKENDYRLPTTQISRVHACIYLRENGVYVEDRESTNGTYINAVRLPALQQTRINVGDIVGFANEEFFVV